MIPESTINQLKAELRSIMGESVTAMDFEQADNLIRCTAAMPSNTGAGEWHVKAVISGRFASSNPTDASKLIAHDWSFTFKFYESRYPGGVGAPMVV